MSNSVPRSRKRVLVLGLTVTVCLLLGRFALPFYHEQLVIQALDRTGGRGKVIRRPIRAARWFPSWTPEIFISTIQGVLVEGGTVEEATVDALTEIDELKGLYLRDANIEMSLGELLCRVPQLTVADFHDCQFAPGRGKGFQASHLESLDISGTTGELDFLHELPELRCLNFSSSDADDNVIEAIIRCRNVVLLKLNTTKVTDRGVARLATYAPLEDLELWETAITDAAIERLADGDGLEYLCVGRDRPGIPIPRVALLFRPRVDFVRARLHHPAATATQIDGFCGSATSGTNDLPLLDGPAAHILKDDRLQHRRQANEGGKKHQEPQRVPAPESEFPHWPALKKNQPDRQQRLFRTNRRVEVPGAIV